MYYYVACVAAGYSPASLNRAFRKESMVFRGTGQCVCLGDSRCVVTWSCITYYAAQRTALDRDNDRTNPMSIHLLPVTAARNARTTHLWRHTAATFLFKLHIFHLLSSYSPQSSWHCAAQRTLACCWCSTITSTRCRCACRYPFRTTAAKSSRATAPQ